MSTLALGTLNESSSLYNSFEHGDWYTTVGWVLTAADGDSFGSWREISSNSVGIKMLRSGSLRPSNLPTCSKVCK